MEIIEIISQVLVGLFTLFIIFKVIKSLRLVGWEIITKRLDRVFMRWFLL